jgi:anhydro-N-acetylmuramic acid kinase
MTKRLKALQPLTVAGIMSGTSGDGIDIAIVRIAPKARGRLSISLRAHAARPFPRSLRTAVLAAQDAQKTSTAELARLHWRLGVAYADALANILANTGESIDLVGCHGQTIYHQGAEQSYAGARFRCTWQIGEMAPLAQAAGVAVVSNFRPADMIVGGQGAPLVPLLDEVLYRDTKRTRILLNLGGSRHGNHIRRKQAPLRSVFFRPATALRRPGTVRRALRCFFFDQLPQSQMHRSRCDCHGDSAHNCHDR